VLRSSFGTDLDEIGFGIHRYGSTNPRGGVRRQCYRLLRCKLFAILVERAPPAALACCETGCGGERRPATWNLANTK